MKKSFIVDTNVILDSPDCIEKLKNGEENNIYLPKEVINELDGLKKDPALNNRVSRAVDKLLEYKDQVKLLQKLADHSYSNKEGFLLFWYLRFVQKL